MIIEDLTLITSKKPELYPLWRLCLSIYAGEKTAIIGESGGGKTSLAWALTGFCLPGQKVLSGRVLFKGKDLTMLDQTMRSRIYYRSLSLVPQEAHNAFHPCQRLMDSARELWKKGRKKAGFQYDFSQRLFELGNRLDIDLELWEHYPHQLSGGQRQRMALVLALLNSPNLLVLDEVTSALDEITQEKVMDFLNEWASNGNRAVVLLGHDMDIALCWADRVLVLYRGQILEDFRPGKGQVPVHPYSKGLFEAKIHIGDPPLSKKGIPGHSTALCMPPKGCVFFDRCIVGHSDRCQDQIPLLSIGEGHLVRCVRNL